MYVENIPIPVQSLILTREYHTVFIVRVQEGRGTTTKWSFFSVANDHHRRRLFPIKLLLLLLPHFTPESTRNINNDNNVGNKIAISSTVHSA